MSMREEEAERRLTDIAGHEADEAATHGRCGAFQIAIDGSPWLLFCGPEAEAARIQGHLEEGSLRLLTPKNVGTTYEYVCRKQGTITVTELAQPPITEEAAEVVGYDEAAKTFRELADARRPRAAASMETWTSDFNRLTKRISFTKPRIVAPEAPRQDSESC